MPSSYTIGRDTACDIVLADASVSRMHAELVLSESGALMVRDCGSENGTRIVRGGRKIRITEQRLSDGDEIEFGTVSIPLQMLLEMVPPGDVRRATPEEDAAARRAVPPPVPSPPSPVLPRPPAGYGDQAASDQGGFSSFRSFLPGASSFQRLKERGLVWPAVGFVLISTTLWSTQDPLDFINYLGIATCLGGFAFVYRLCGKRKPLLVFAAVMAAEWLILKQFGRPYFYLFRELPNIEGLMDSTSRVEQFVGHFIGAGLMEELMKMTPAFIIIWLTARSKRRDKKSWGAVEPLDVILLATAAATAFVMIETLEQYVPRAINRVAKQTGNDYRAILEGGQLAILRTLSGMSGHLSYSGYFGYFVGLGLLRPRQRTRLWLGGWAVAAALHGLNNATGGISTVSMLVDAVCFFFLMAVIVNARRISPNRQENFATMFVGRERGLAAQADVSEQHPPSVSL